MAEKTRILIQLDTDAHASTFDRVVAIDAGAEQLFSYGGVTPDNVESLVHGAIFTRGPADLKHTAIFVGGSNVAAGEAVLAKVRKTFFPPLTCSIMLDSNGANTTAAAAVLAAAEHLKLVETTALVLGGTGPVGQRAARLLAREGAAVRLGSRTLERAKAASESISATVEGSEITPYVTGNDGDLGEALYGVELVIAAGAAGIQLLPVSARSHATNLKVMIDLNAVPPAGIEGVEVTDKAEKRMGVTSYGAIGVGGRKMKIHKAAVAVLFESNDKDLDAEAIYAIGKSL